MISYHSKDFQGGSPNIPDADKDFYRSTDWIRDFGFLWQQAGRSLKDIYDQFPILLSGGKVTIGSSVSEIDITPAVGYAAHTIKVPVDYSTNPPVVTDETFDGVRVASTQQTDLLISGTATLDGVSVNYVKLSYAEAGSLTRSRLKGAGTYVYEQNESFSIVVDTVAATDSDIVLADIVGDGSTFLTITTKSTSVLSQLMASYQNNNNFELPSPAGYKLWAFDDNSLLNSDGVYPKKINGPQYIGPDDAKTKFDTVGQILLNTENVLIYDYAWTNNFTIKFRIRPEFSYNTGLVNVLLDSYSQSSTDDDLFVLQYDPVLQNFTLLVRENATNYIRTLSTVYTSDLHLQQWIDIAIVVDKSGNDVIFYIDGVIQTNKTVFNNGITNINLTVRDELAIGCNNKKEDGAGLFASANMYISQFIINPTTADNTTDNYDGGVSFPYAVDNRLTGINNYYTQRQGGDIAARKLSANAINNGSGYIRKIVLPIGAWDMATTTIVTLPFPTGLIIANVQSLTAIITSDTGSITHPIDHPIDTLGRIGGGVSMGATGISLVRVDNANNGACDNINYNSKTLNRGYVYIDYLVN